MRAVLGCNYPARKVRGFLPHRADLPRIEGHRRRRPGICSEDLCYSVAKPHVFVETAFHFDQHCYSAGDEIAQIRKTYDVFGAVAESYALKFGRTQLIEPSFAFGEATEHLIVIDHRLTVGADLHIDFESIAGGNRRTRRACGILDLNIVIG
jgi:hypothetical protein